MACRILIVDDDVDILESLRELLAYVPDAEVVTAPGYREGRALALGQAWDIIISDEHMPEGRGSDLLSQVHRERPGAHLVLMSGFSDFDMLVRGVITAHIDHFVQKPYDGDRVLEWVKRVAQERAQAGGAPPQRMRLFRRVGGPAPEPRATAPLTLLTATPPSTALPALPAPGPMMPDEPPEQRAAPHDAARDGVRDALDRTASVGLQDIALLIRWADEAERPAEKLKHLRLAMRRMEDTARNLEALDARE